MARRYRKEDRCDSIIEDRITDRIIDDLPDDGEGTPPETFYWLWEDGDVIQLEDGSGNFLLEDAA